MDTTTKIQSFLTILICSVVVVNCSVLVTDSVSGNKLKVTGPSEARKKQQDVMSMILPMMAMPFIMQVTSLPMMLMSMKFMLMKSVFLGKLAILFGLVLLLRNSLKSGDSFFSHNVNLIPHQNQ